MKSEKRVLLLLAASAAVIILVTVLTLFSGKDTEPAVNRPKPTATPKGAEPTAAIVAEYDKLLMVKSVPLSAPLKLPCSIQFLPKN